MRRIGAALIILAVRVCASGIVNNPCPTNGTLGNLIALNNNPVPGCEINGLNFSGFSWTKGPNSSTTLDPGQVDFTTDFTVNSAIITFTSSGFSVTGGNTLEYTLTYEVDPPPIIIRTVTDDLETSTPVAPGFAHLPATVCLGAPFTPGNVCNAANQTLDTFHNGTPSGNQLIDSTTFPVQNTIGISTFFDLEANGASSEITGLQSIVTFTPEPANYLPALFGLAAIGWLRRKCARLSSSSFRKSD